MVRLTSNLAYRFRLATNRNQAVGRNFSWRRNYAAQDYRFGVEESPFKDYEYDIGNAWLPCNIENPACDVIQDEWVKVRGYRYTPVLSRGLHDEGRKVLVAGVNYEDLRKGVDLANRVVNEYLRSIARKIRISKEIVQLATTIGDRRIGELMVEAVKKVGKNGLYLISVVEKVINELEFDNRMHLDWRFVLTYGPYFINDEWNKKCVCVVVPTRSRAEKNKAIMEDLAIFTGGQVVTAVSDINSISSMLGSCQEVIISSLSMTIIGGSGSQKNIDKRREQLESRSVVADSCSELEFLKERLANLSLRAATFKVGGATSEEMVKNSIRACNVVRAVQYAIKDGFVAGGGVALLHASKELDKVQITNSTQKLGVQLFQHVLKLPVYSIATRAGFDGTVVIERLLEEEDPDLGYDPAKGEYVDMLKAGNMDPYGLISEELYDLIRSFFSVFRRWDSHRDNPPH